MDLTSVTTNYKSLADKYGNFRAPTIEVTVGGTKLVSGSTLNIAEVDVDLTCEMEASGCVFYVVGGYQAKKTDFVSAVEKLQLGENVEILLGYIRLESVFKGYINKIDYEFGMEQDAYTIRVECMDAKGLLMKNRRLEFFPEKSADKVVSSLLGENPVSGYLSGKTVDPCPEEEIALRANMLTDYEIIVEQAQKYGYEFFILQGKAYFRKKEKVTSSLMKLSPRFGIRKARLSLSGQGLFENAEIRSIDQENAKAIQGQMKIKGKFSKGGSANKMIKGSRQVFYEAGVKDAKEAKDRAENRIQASAQQFGLLDCECIGIPEIGPGRFVDLEGLSGVADGKYYITQVRHTVDTDGFRTTFKARVDSL